MGKVVLVGAGPYDKSLLTVAAVEEIKKAEVVVYDRLVSPEILDLIPSTAKQINVGKQVGHHPVKQSRINEILVEEAQKGQYVVRLKGGDGFLFGRGGEELELLVEQGVEFKVIPGISSSLSVPALAGIPVTHRDYCSSVHIITGHKKEDESLDMDFDALVRLKGTLVFMMSVSSSPDIMKGLLAAGIDSDMPVAIIEKGSSPKQRKIVTTVEKLEFEIKQAKVQSPAIVVVGKVCSLDFDWFTNRPLFGKKLLVTKPSVHADKMLEALRTEGAMVEVAATIVVEPLSFELPDISQYQWILFTSGNGVHEFFKKLREESVDARSFAHCKFATVGKQTASALLQYGIISDFTPSVYEGACLARELEQEEKLTKEQKILFVRGETNAGSAQRYFQEMGYSFDELTCYTSKVECKDLGDLEDYQGISFTSVSGVEAFTSRYGKQEQMIAFCIGESTGKAAREWGFQVVVSKEASVSQLVETIKEYFHDK